MKTVGENEARRAENRGRRPTAGEEFLGRGRKPLPPAKESGEHCELPQRGYCAFDDAVECSFFMYMRLNSQSESQQ